MSQATAIGLRSYGADSIRALLPHRWPMLLLDRVYDVVPGIRGTGIKNVTISEPFFSGHFPTVSIMPGVLIIEALAQLSAVVLASAGAKVSSDDTAPAFLGTLGAVKRMKFTRLILPGDQITLHAEVLQRYAALVNVQVRAAVGSQEAATGALTINIVD